MLLKSKLLTAGVPSPFSGMIYSRAILEANVERLLSVIENGGLLGELGSPFGDIKNISFSNASHKVMRLWWEGDDLWAEALVLGTPSGQILSKLVGEGCSVRLATRGVGCNEGNVVLDDYKLVTVDATFDR